MFAGAARVSGRSADADSSRLAKRSRLWARGKSVNIWLSGACALDNLARASVAVSIGQRRFQL
jgi:hypothetical protein